MQDVRDILTFWLVLMSARWWTDLQRKMVYNIRCAT